MCGVCIELDNVSVLLSFVCVWGVQFYLDVLVISCAQDRVTEATDILLIVQ